MSYNGNALDKLTLTNCLLPTHPHSLNLKIKLRGKLTLAQILIFQVFKIV